MPMREKITRNNMFDREPTRSILNLLMEFHGKEDIYFRDMYDVLNPRSYDNQSEISDDLEFQHNRERRKRIFGDILDKIYAPIYYKGDMFASLVKQGCITNKRQLRYYISVLGEKGLNVIGQKGYAKKARYFIKETIYREAVRIQNQMALDIFPRNMIIKNSYDTKRTDVLYGLSEKLFNAHKKSITNNLEEIEKRIRNIEKIKDEDLMRQVKWRITNFIDKLPNGNIKEAFEYNGYNFWVTTQYVLMFRSKWKSWGKRDVDSAALISKDVFYEGMSWPWQIEGGKYPLDSPNYVPFGEKLPFLLRGGDLYKFLLGMSSEKLSKDDVIAEYRRLWSWRFFFKDFDFSLGEIKKMIKWGWDNRDLFYEYFPLSVAFSSYKECRTFSFTPHHYMEMKHYKGPFQQKKFLNKN